MQGYKHLRDKSWVGGIPGLDDKFGWQNMAEDLAYPISRHVWQNIVEDLVYLVPNTVGRRWQKI